ncbi:MAG: hypothetical protein ACO1O6_12950 [Bacteroidota bacterium]
MEHRGEIIEQAIRKSGYPITKVAEKIGKSRRWMYLMFDNPAVPYEVIIRIGKIIHHDFSAEISELKANIPGIFTEGQEPYITAKDKDAAYWRQKYYDLLEEYNAFLKKEKAGLEGKKRK